MWREKKKKKKVIILFLCIIYTLTFWVEKSRKILHLILYTNNYGIFVMGCCFFLKNEESIIFIRVSK